VEKTVFMYCYLIKAYHEDKRPNIVYFIYSIGDGLLVQICLAGFFSVVGYNTIIIALLKNPELCITNTFILANCRFP